MKRNLLLIFIVAIFAIFIITGVTFGGLDNPQTPGWTTTAVSPNFTTGQVPIASTATVIIATPTIVTPRSITITNTGGVTVWIGPRSSVTTSTGKSIPAGQSLTIDRCQLTGGIFGIVTSTAGSIDYIME